MENTVHPTWLPQINSPYDELLKRLNKGNVPYKVLNNVDPNTLKPLQDYVNRDSVSHFNKKIVNREEIPLTVITQDDEILDGHHRVSAFRLHPDIKQIFCLKIFLPKEDAARELNKIEDRYNWEKSLEEQILEKKKDKQKEEQIKKNTFKLYSTKPISQHNPSFLQLEKHKNHKFDYEISFDNIYEITEEKYDQYMKEYGDVFEGLANEWKDKEVSLKEESNKTAMVYEAYIRKFLFKESKKRGYDGIKFGNKFIKTIP